MDHSEVKNLKRCDTCGLHHGHHTHEQWEARHERPKVDHTPAELDEASQVLLRAAALLDKPNQWGQGGSYPEKVCGPHCVMTAIWSIPNNEEAAARFREHLNGAVFEWNDMPGRTKDEVVAKLRAVALGIV